MGIIYAVLMCSVHAGGYCETWGNPSAQNFTAEQCESWATRMNEPDRSFPDGKAKGRTPVWYECFSKEVPVWKSTR